MFVITIRGYALNSEKIGKSLGAGIVNVDYRTKH
jgi:hypothetical protein